MTNDIKKLTFQPVLTYTYQLDNLQILPQDYHEFLTYAAKIHHDHGYHLRPKEQKLFPYTLSLHGNIAYTTPPHNQAIEVLDNKLVCTKQCTESLGDITTLDVNLYTTDIMARIEDATKVINDQLDHRFEGRKGKFPHAYFSHYDIMSTSLAIHASYRNLTLPLELDIILHADSTTATDYQHRKYPCLFEPKLTLTLRDDCTKLSKLEKIANNLEQLLQQFYTFNRKTTTISKTQRTTVELAEEKAQKIKAA